MLFLSDIYCIGSNILLQSFFPAMTKIVGTLGPKSRSVDIISRCLEAGMSGTVPFFFFFSPAQLVIFIVTEEKLEGIMGQNPSKTQTGPPKTRRLNLG